MARGAGGGGAMGHRHTLNPKYAWGTPEYIANIDKAGFQPDSPSYMQIGPGAGPGGNMNDLHSDRVGGHFKFTKGNVVSVGTAWDPTFWIG